MATGKGRSRDYRREYLQRVAKARAEGFTSPSQATRARKTVREQQVTFGPKPKAKTYDARVRANQRAQDAGFKNDYQLRKYLRNQVTVGKRKRTSADLSAKQYSTAVGSGMSPAEIAALHYHVWSANSLYSKYNRPFESWIRDPMTRRWYVDVMRLYTDVEYDARYGTAEAAA